jgi:hypothetical protein
LALKAGEPYRIARALAMEAGFVSTGGAAAAARAARLVAAARELADKVGHPHALALADMTAGIAQLQLGHWAEARDLLMRAAERFRDRCTGVSWEMATTQAFLLVALFYLGSFAQLGRSVPALLGDATARGDLYAATNAQLSHMNLAWLLAGDEEAARQQIESAMQAWAPTGYLAQHYYELVARVQLELYGDRGAAAWALVQKGWHKLEASLFMKVQFIRIEAHHLRARAALAAAARAASTGGERNVLLTVADKEAATLEGEKAPWAAALAKLVRAAVAHQRGDATRAQRLTGEAAEALAALSMSGYAAAARHRLAQLTGADSAASAQALAALAQPGVQEPMGLVRMLAPGF